MARFKHPYVKFDAPGNPTVLDAVLCGAALLDVELPGWRSRVDVQALDMRSATSCIVGQLTGYYGRTFIGWRVFHDPIEYGLGFDVPLGGDYDALTAAWRAVITQ